MAKYTTEAKLETYLNKAIATGEANDAIAAAEKLIDQYTGRNFKADTEASIRYYDGNGKQDLVIDDCVEITKVEVGSNYYGDAFDEIDDGSEEPTNRYYVIPANYEEEGLPIRKLRLRTRFWIEGFQNQRITAKWGYSTTAPDDIVLAATILAAGFYQYGRSGASGGIKSEKIGDYSVGFSEGQWEDYERIKKILDNYRKIEL